MLAAKTTNTWLQTFGSQHSIVESRFPSPLDSERRPTVLLDRVCVHVYECSDGVKRFLCARQADSGSMCDEHDRDEHRGEASPWRPPHSLPEFSLERESVVAYIDGLWIDVNTVTRADTGDAVDFVDDILLW